MTYRDAISKAMVDFMAANPDSIAFGVGVGDGEREVFGTTANIRKQFPGRVIDTPICENTLQGIANGLAVGGSKPILIHARCDFAFFSFDQLINHAAIWSDCFNRKLDFLVRMIVGRGWGQGPQHSKDIHSMLMSVPNLRVLLSGTARDAYYNICHGMDGPTIVFEYRHLYDLEDDGDPVASIRRGKQSRLTIVSIGGTYRDCRAAAVMLEGKGMIVDFEHIRERRTFRIETPYALIVDYGWGQCSYASEVASMLMELDGRRSEIVAFPPVHCGTSRKHESGFYWTAEGIASKAWSMLNEGEYLDFTGCMPAATTVFKGPY